MTERERVELVERLQRASRDLAALGGAAKYDTEKIRLNGKAQGVRLALSYVEEMGR